MQKPSFALTAKALLDAAMRPLGDSAAKAFGWWADLADSIGPALLPFLTRPEEYALAPLEELGLAPTPLRSLTSRRGEMWVLFCFRPGVMIDSLCASPLRSDGFPLILEWRKGCEDSLLLSSALRTLAAQVRRQFGVDGWGLHPAFDRYGDAIDFTDSELFSDAEHVDNVASAWGALAAGLWCVTTGRFPPEWTFPTIQWDEKRGCSAGVAGLRQKLSVAADCGATVVTVARSQRREATGILHDLCSECDGRRYKNLRLYPVRDRRSPKDAAAEVALGFSDSRRLRRRIAAAVLLPLLAALSLGGIYYWDTHRAISKYYAAVVYHYGLPQGIYPVKPEVQRHRLSTFRFDYVGALGRNSIHGPWLPKALFGQPRRLVRVVSVNSRGIPAPYEDCVLGTVPVVQEFDYVHAQLKTVVCRRRGGEGRESGRVEKVLHYEDRISAENTTLPNARMWMTSDLGCDACAFVDASSFQRQPGDSSDEKSRASEYVIMRDSMGRMTTRHFQDSDKNPVTDGDGAGGQAYAYQEDGLVSHIWNLGLNTTNCVADKYGVVRQDFIWSKGDNVETSYHGLDDRLVFGRIGACRIINQNDEFGNSVKTVFLGPDGRPEYENAGTFEIPCAGMEYVIVNGQAISQYFLDGQGKRMSGEGIAAVRCAYDENGDVICSELLDGNGHLRPGKDGVACVLSKIDARTGSPVEIGFRGADGVTPAYGSSDRASIIRHAYDDEGNCVETRMFDGQGKPMVCAAGYAISHASYRHGKIEAIAYYDDAGRPVWHNKEGFSCAKWKYESKTGNVKSQRFYADDTWCSLQLDMQGVAGWEAEYDDAGRVVRYMFVDESDRFSASNAYGVAGWKFEYGAFPSEEHLPGYGRLGAGGKTIIKTYVNRDGLTPMRSSEGYAVERDCLDHTGKIVARYFLDEKGNRCAQKKSEMSAMTWRYDTGGRLAEERYFNCEDFPCLAPDGWSYGTRFRYNERHQEIGRIFLGKDGAPANVNAHSYCEERYAYDEYGHQVGVSYWAADGMPALNEEGGYHKSKKVYDQLGRLISISYFGTNNEPVVISTDGIRCWRSTCERDVAGNVVSEFYYDQAGRLIPGSGESAYFRKTYDTLRRLVDWCWYDAMNKPCVNGDGVSRIHTRYYGVSARIAMNEYFTGAKEDHCLWGQRGVKRLIEHYEDSIETEPSAIQLFDADGNELKAEWTVQVSSVGEYLQAKCFDIRKGDLLCGFGDLKISRPCRYRDIKEQCETIAGLMAKQMVLARKEGEVYKIRKFDFGPGPTGVSFSSTKRTEAEFAAMLSAFQATERETCNDD